MDTMTNLMLLHISDFDAILGMDWLASCHATLDYHGNAIKFNMPGGPAFVFQGDRSEV